MSDPLTVADIHRALDQREARILARTAEQAEARDKLVAAQLETLAVRLGAETAARIDALWRNGGGFGGIRSEIAELRGVVETRLDAADDRLDTLESYHRTPSGQHQQAQPDAPLAGIPKWVGYTVLGLLAILAALLGVRLPFLGG